MGVQTEADVCNLGLVAIGNTQLIDELNDPTPAARVAKAVYANARDATLERVEWKFATRRRTLAMLVDADTDPDSELVHDGWRFVYGLPPDCIAPRRIVVPGMRAPPPRLRIPFEIEASDSSGKVDGLVLLTDQPEAELLYTARVMAPALFTALFAEALSWMLASKFALAIQKKPAVAVTMDQKFERSIAVALTSNFRQAHEDLPPDSEFILERG